jgi:hypothetical protein
MLDAIERLGRSSTLIDLKTGAQTPQERGIALLERCGVIRTMVNLFDEFRIFGVIISIESLPRPKMVDQFIHVSADLARFTTMLLQIFTWGDTCKFLAQKPEDMGEDWAATFRNLGGTFIFSEGEQRWLLEQGGSHPYLLQQFCFYTFQLKALTDTWTDIQEIHKTQLTSWINERVSTFLSTTWKRLQVALRLSSRPKEIQAQFYEFIAFIAPLLAEDEISSEFWYSLHPELRYILSSEGILRYDPFKPIHAPGITLRNYLVQKAQETHRYTVSPHIPLTPPTPDRGYWLRISKPERDPELLSLSELEYQLLKTLLSHTDRCTEKELMLGAWNQIIERATFTQRMHKLRKKLQKHFDGEDIIVNTYGGIYSLLHPEWIQLE